MILKLTTKFVLHGNAISGRAQGASLGYYKCCKSISDVCAPAILCTTRLTLHTHVHYISDAPMDSVHIGNAIPSTAHRTHPTAKATRIVRATRTATLPGSL